ncbi:arginyl-tRNA-protein transferase [Novipirellula aureliae]|uniref:Arginyl-tRNA-protein transferase n=1 Tax=Novipirellula aureliae TaxID=2527966 RepID=A0A5C6E9L3_9BACT|nr:arginyltransferase [Novipirellula aureliae]TWU43869.1 arginyl-tRNA-protein transferase [Novipirellula aureliae]
MSRPNELRLPDDTCRLVVIQDQLQTCPYIPDETARTPLRLPIGNVTPEITDRMLALGFRRSGNFVYRTECPSCNECKPTRLKVADFRLTKSLRRVMQRGDRDLVCCLNAPSGDEQRLKMFNEHRLQRGLGQRDEPIDASEYLSFLCDTCCDTLELSIYRDGNLVAISVFDVGRESTSAVYTHFDPSESRFSLGTYAVLKQVEWARKSGRQFVYLGMYVAVNPHLNYKARFKPQQRLLDDVWVDSP